jgi:H+-transporting ATPase
MLLVTRAKGPFWRPPYPAAKLCWAVVVTQILAAVMAVRGRVIPEITWELVGIVWSYCMVWMFVIDFVRLALYRQLDERQHTRLAGRHT